MRIMFKTFYPDEYVASTYVLDFEKMYREGCRGLVFDIDNTLVPHGAPADERAICLFDRLRSIGFDTCLISNNQEPRVKPFAEKVQSKYVFNAHKPSTKNYIKAMELMQTDRGNTVFIGDQLFTDVWGAKRTGMKSILVKPINPKEEIQIDRKFRKNFPSNKRHCVPKMCTRTKMKNVASDCARRENVPWHILFSKVNRNPPGSHNENQGTSGGILYLQNLISSHVWQEHSGYYVLLLYLR